MDLKHRATVERPVLIFYTKLSTRVALKVSYILLTFWPKKLFLSSVLFYEKSKKYGAKMGQIILNRSKMYKIPLKSYLNI